jgi:GntR family transcriptional regulator, vanillate catabolism transcriptional regulator
MQKFQKVKHSDGYDLEKSEFGMQSEDVEAGADTQLERATEALRELVLRGAFPVDEKLPEAKVAELLGVSRTPARLAMAVLEQDGLLVRLPRRGFRVRSFSLDEVVEAIEVRGEIEAIAARLVAERGLKPQFRTRLEACIGRAEVILKNPVLEAAQRRDWCQMNLDFHDALIAAAGVRPLISAFAKVNLVPLASPRDTMFNVVRPELTRRQLEAAHADHTHILDAILARQSTKRRNFPDIQMRTMVVETPGVALVRADPMPV